MIGSDSHTEQTVQAAELYQRNLWKVPYDRRRLSATAQDKPMKRDQLKRWIRSDLEASLTTVPLMVGLPERRPNLKLNSIVFRFPQDSELYETFQSELFDYYLELGRDGNRYVIDPITLMVLDPMFSEISS
jgi:hypothetical protein